MPTTPSRESDSNNNSRFAFAFAFAFALRDASTLCFRAGPACATPRRCADGHGGIRRAPREQAGEKFNAHWAAAAVFDVSPDFNTGHAQALVIAMHENHLADAYGIFPFDNYEQVKRQIDENPSALAFLP